MAAAEPACRDSTHQVLTDLEHVLERPDSYIGAVAIVEETVFEFVPASSPPAQDSAGDPDRSEAEASDADGDKDDDASRPGSPALTPPPDVPMQPRQSLKQKLKGFRAVPYTARVSRALQQLFLEIVTNASDHASRPDTGVKNIRLAFDDATGAIEVTNDGQGIPVRQHEQLVDQLLPTVIFSNFRCGSNFDDTQERMAVAGRNGFGAKLTNAWSTLFEIETVHAGQRFQQTWSDNMRTTAGPTVTKGPAREYTTVRFVPDYARLGVPDVPEALRYLRTFAWHLGAASPAHVTVWLDGAKLPVRNLRHYATVLAGPDGFVMHATGTHLEVAVIPANLTLAPLGTLGFVNGIPCHQGSHVRYAALQACRLAEQAGGGARVTDALLRNYAMVLVRCNVDKPCFDHQTKQKLVMPKHGLAWTLGAKDVAAFKRTGLPAQLRAEIDFRDVQRGRATAARKVSGSARRVDIDKYEGAELAGQPKRADPCYLLLTEGKSAKGFALSGVGVVGRRQYGIYPLRGKMINARDKSEAAVLANAEVKDLLAILGMPPDRTASAPRDLRYDGIIILADQDVDGSHIAGLILTFLAVFAPALLAAHPTFVKRFGTALVRAVPRGAQAGALEAREFMTEPAFESWWNELPEAARRQYSVKYFKGLGTSTPRQAMAYFTELDKYVIDIDCTAADDLDLLDACFAGKRVEERRDLIRTVQPKEHAIEYSGARVSLRQFLYGELVPYFNSSLERMLPSMVDGLKESQRKILFVLLQRNITVPDIKVAQLQGDVAEKTLYQHGEENLGETARRMAAQHGSNNLNLLVPEGNFGNRHGDPAASTRYIFTCLERIARALFPAGDDPVLPRVQCEGKAVEPHHMVPVIPFVLCNGADGIGTGYSCEVPSFHPLEVLHRVGRWLQAYDPDLDVTLGRPCEALVPFMELFGRHAEPNGAGRWIYRGTVDQVDPNTVRVSNLPGATGKFQAGLAADLAKRGVAFFVEVNNTHLQVDLVYRFHEPVAAEVVKAMQDRAVLKVRSDNMTGWTHAGVVHRYEAPEDVIPAHAEVRLTTYALRRQHQLRQLSQERARASNRLRFILAVMADPLRLHRQPVAAVEAWLLADAYDKDEGSYDYLLRLTTRAFTEERVRELEATTASLETRIAEVESTMPARMWLTELEAFELAYADFEETRRVRREVPSDASLAAGGPLRSVVGARGKPRAGKPKATKPKAPKPKAPKPKAIKPKAVKPKAVRPKAVKLGGAALEMTEEATVMEAMEPSTSEPPTPEAIDPAASKPAKRERAVRETRASKRSKPDVPVSP